jgi:hypothetical protein
LSFSAHAAVVTAHAAVVAAFARAAAGRGSAAAAATGRSASSTGRRSTLTRSTACHRSAGRATSSAVSITSIVVFVIAASYEDERNGNQQSP